MEQRGTTPNHLSAVAAGRKQWDPQLRARATEALGEVPGPEVVYRQGGVVCGRSSCIRLRVRKLGMSMWDFAERVGVSQNEVARLAGLSVGRLWYIVSGTASPSLVVPPLHGALYHRWP